MYDGATTTVRSAAGLTEKFKAGVGFHQGSVAGRVTILRLENSLGRVQRLPSMPYPSA